MKKILCTTILFLLFFKTSHTTSEKLICNAAGLELEFELNDKDLLIKYHENNRHFVIDTDDIACSNDKNQYTIFGVFSEHPSYHSFKANILSKKPFFTAAMTFFDWEGREISSVTFACRQAGIFIPEAPATAHQAFIAPWLKEHEELLKEEPEGTFAIRKRDPNKENIKRGAYALVSVKGKRLHEIYFDDLFSARLTGKSPASRCIVAHIDTWLKNGDSYKNLFFPGNISIQLTGSVSPSFKERAEARYKRIIEVREAMHRLDPSRMERVKSLQAKIDSQEYSELDEDKMRRKIEHLLNGTFQELQKIEKTLDGPQLLVRKKRITMRG